MTKCRICGCTYNRPCPAGCAWVGREDLCSVCHDFGAQLEQYLDQCHRVTKASLARLYDEAVDPPQAKRLTAGSAR